MKTRFLFLLVAIFPFFNLVEATKENLFLPSEEHKTITLNNKILAKINGKAISLLDVTKKMDMLFYRSFPEYTSSTTARFQFYQMNWKKILQDLVDKELIMADAEESKMQVSNGDIRQEMETLFGPNIIGNLDKVGLTFDEAWKMVYSDILLKRMLYVRGHSKAIKKITPQLVRLAYENYASENKLPETWTYQVISIREQDPVKGAEAAYQVYRILVEEHLPLEELAKQLEGLASIASTTKITTSELFCHSEHEISTTYKTTLSSLKPGEYSQPTTQKSRTDRSNVYRIFFLKDYRASGYVPFKEVAKQLKEKLTEEAAEEETAKYLTRLRKHFDVQDNHLEDLPHGEFEPFYLN